jgi:hypothetical protein
MTKDERDAVLRLPSFSWRCQGEWCDGHCDICEDDVVELRDALAAIDSVRHKARNERAERLKFLLDDD